MLQMALLRDGKFSGAASLSSLSGPNLQKAIPGKREEPGVRKVCPGMAKRVLEKKFFFAMMENDFI
ncbi:MAG: hypothetical protein C6P37_10080 [Caldibacillus debilis]|jgi:hypothetical protein|uniref:Uncharacterized protein n=1 Tax=Caldibacillus debilis TaxID=301148 RepID=A0A3E0K3T6_9BACI|nr:hypothetical protein [Caldibacillus debilis]MBY6274046.1 hypothetical protein [Bacillaceae bacterium]OUM90087.1 MAG: hypothetical protein BAA03_11240 [Caldibacillus debilis]REJ25470.1 MAG: hypothetical protein C6W56_13590 [Caldibacillus debilis]REJ27803.1 MAG: hypothetical protein C6P37_10080 [Caldibacillus debilis]